MSRHIQMHPSIESSAKAKNRRPSEKPAFDLPKNLAVWRKTRRSMRPHQGGSQFARIGRSGKQRTATRGQFKKLLMNIFGTFVRQFRRYDAYNPMLQPMPNDIPNNRWRCVDKKLTRPRGKTMKQTRICRPHIDKFIPIRHILRRRHGKHQQRKYTRGHGRGARLGRIEHRNGHHRTVDIHNAPYLFTRPLKLRRHGRRNDVFHMSPTPMTRLILTIAI